MTLDLPAALTIIASGPASADERSRAWAVVDEALRGEWSSAIAHRAGVAANLDDVRQLVLEKLLAGRPRFRGDGEDAARALLRVLVHRTAVDLRRARARETPFPEDDTEPSNTHATETIDARDLQIRLRELIEAAATIRRSPDAATLERHLREALLGQPAADPSVDVDVKAAAALRQERSRSFALLRDAQLKLLPAAKPAGRPDALDHLVGQLIAPRRGGRDGDD